ncbi:MAG: ClC family H(+)/Cl(-) exchange transporter [Treponema sp.]
MQPNSKETKLLDALTDNYLVLVLESLLIGILTGFVITSFRFSINYVAKIVNATFLYLRSFNVLYLLALIPVFAIFGLIMGFIINKYPMIRGGGVAQLEGVFLKRLKLSVWPELPLKFIGGVMDIGLGLSMGREGPSVQIGAYVGDAVEKIGKRSFTERVCLITAGAAAGLAGTFSAPFAGILFAIEDLHQYFSPILLACVMAGSFASDFVVGSILGRGNAFSLNASSNFPLNNFAYLVGLGVLIAIIGHLFKKSIYMSQSIYTHLHIPLVLRPIVPFLLVIPFYLLFGYVNGGGDALIEAIQGHNFPLYMLLLLLFAKLFFTGLSAGSGAIGGIFVPLFACGALGGLIYAKVLVNYNLLDPAFEETMMIFGMVACFATVIKAPLTACAIIIETCGNLHYLGGLILTSLIAYTTANLIGSKAHDEVLLSQILKENVFKDDDIKAQ